jgi:hypothetical protein
MLGLRHLHSLFFYRFVKTCYFVTFLEYENVLNSRIIYKIT